jgi:hypothetical protein
MRPFQKDPLDLEIGRLYRFLKDLEPASPVYERVMARLESLEKIRAAKHSKDISGDTLGVIAGALIQTYGIIQHEKIDVFGSKAIGFIMKMTTKG